MGNGQDVICLLCTLNRASGRRLGLNKTRADGPPNFMNSRLYVGNLSPEVTEENLRSLFSKSGTVAEVKLMLDPVTNQSRGFAFVTMATPESAAAALRDFHCHGIGGRYITVTEARPPQEPKGMMSEGFGLGATGAFRPTPSRPKTHRGPPRSSRPRNRRR